MPYRFFAEATSAFAIKIRNPFVVPQDTPRKVCFRDMKGPSGKNQNTTGIPSLNGKRRIRALLTWQPLGQAAVGLSEMEDHLNSSDPSKILVNLIT